MFWDLFFALFSYKICYKTELLMYNPNIFFHITLGSYDNEQKTESISSNKMSLKCHEEYKFNMLSEMWPVYFISFLKWIIFLKGSICPHAQK